MTTYDIPTLPLDFDVETTKILKQLAKSHKALAELKGTTGIIPNQGILIQTLSLQEAWKSSEIENIITTQDDLYKSDLISKTFASTEAKEVYSYVDALRTGYMAVKENGILANKTIIKLFEDIQSVDTGFRSIPVFLKDNNGNVIYIPPEKQADIQEYMTNLELFINDSSVSDLDPLVKMAIIHHQFESIHPFHDGNGRSGRIINILYLVKEDLLSLPVLYLSRYINTNKQKYYDLLQKVRQDSSYWTEWIMFMLIAVEETAQQTTVLIKTIRDSMLVTKNKLRNELPKIYSQDLINIIFSNPYTKTKFLENDLGITNKTARKYLDELSNIGVLRKEKIWKENYYINNDLVNILITKNDKEE